MARVKKRYCCVECGFTTESFLGKCPQCGTFESLKEERLDDPAENPRGFSLGSGFSVPLSLDEVALHSEKRKSTGIGEVDRVLGGGIVSGSLTLIGGEPGIGKSTLLLQVAAELTRSGWKILYVSGEESPIQIKLRADRLRIEGRNFLVLTENSAPAIESRIDEEKPDMVIIDSIQTMIIPEISGSPGSLVQVRETAGRFLRLAKGTGLPLIMTGHVTKEGNIAGPRVLEHMVDTVLYIESDTKGLYRLLRGVKNRFGSTDEVGIFEMSAGGLREVTNPASVFRNARGETYPGVVSSVTLEGTRPLIVEVESLVTFSPFPQPRRTATGIDYNRLAVCVAVLEKRGGARISGNDIYVNIGGGLKLADPALDLAVCVALFSAVRDRPVPRDCCFIGETGLTGEIRFVPGIETRIREAARAGFSRAIIPRVPDVDTKGVNIEVEEVLTIREALRAVPGRVNR